MFISTTNVGSFHAINELELHWLTFNIVGDNFFNAATGLFSDKCVAAKAFVVHITTLKFILRILGMLMMEVTTGLCNEGIINNMPYLYNQ